MSMGIWENHPRIMGFIVGVSENGGLTSITYSHFNGENDVWGTTIFSQTQWCNKSNGQLGSFLG
jgi:hypothetical protein